MPPADQLRALTAAEKFVRTQMTAADLVAIMRYSGGAVDVLQDFTDDRNAAQHPRNAGGRRRPGRRRERTATTARADTGAAFGQDDGEFNIFNTDRQLAALQTAAKMLGS